MRTRCAIVIDDDSGAITIPKGTHVSPCGDGSGRYFVEDIGFLAPGSRQWHNANYYGLRVTADQVEGEHP